VDFLPQASEATEPVQPARELKAQVRAIMDQLSVIKQGIADIETRGVGPSAPEKNRVRGMTALMDHQLCMNCGMCIEACPEQAISMNAITEIDSGKCTGCGSCINSCPNGAISLHERAM
jgi:ferredoxin